MWLQTYQRREAEKDKLDDAILFYDAQASILQHAAHVLNDPIGGAIDFDEGKPSGNGEASWVFLSLLFALSILPWTT